MKRNVLALAALVLAATSVQAHFVWIVPNKANPKQALIVFSDGLKADENVPIDAIKQVKTHVVQGPTKKTTAVLTKSGNAFALDLPDAKGFIVDAACTYGVLQRGDSKPFLLHYYAQLIPHAETAGLTWAQQPLECVVTPAAKTIRGTVTYQRKPVADAEVVGYVPGDQDSVTVQTDAEGRFEIPRKGDGFYAVRVRHIEPVKGELDGKAYEEVRRYGTVVFPVSAKSAAPVATPPGVKPVAEKRSEDPEASRLLAEARGMRANWANFPGFTAEIVINFDGVISKGTVAIDAKGNVSLDGLSKEAETWARRQLGSVVSHRIDNSADRNTPCAFADDDVTHPLGRAISVLNDELHSSYRVRDKQIIVVNRAMQGSRFSITVLENHQNVENKFLPASFVVHYWDAKTGELQRTEATLQTWQRIRSFDLPVMVQVITASKELTTKSLTLLNHQLAARSER